VNGVIRASFDVNGPMSACNPVTGQPDTGQPDTGFGHGLLNAGHWALDAGHWIFAPHRSSLHDHHQDRWRHAAPPRDHRDRDEHGEQEADCLQRCAPGRALPRLRAPHGSPRRRAVHVFPRRARAVARPCGLRSRGSGVPGCRCGAGSPLDPPAPGAAHSTSRSSRPGAARERATALAATGGRAGARARLETYMARAPNRTWLVEAAEAYRQRPRSRPGLVSGSRVDCRDRAATTRELQLGSPITSSSEEATTAFSSHRCSCC
jgi:hypothetical protein